MERFPYALATCHKNVTNCYKKSEQIKVHFWCFYLFPRDILCKCMWNAGHLALMKVVTLLSHFCCLQERKFDDNSKCCKWLTQNEVFPIKFKKHIIHLRVSTQDQPVYGVILSLWSKIYKENVLSTFSGKLNKLARCQLVKLVV